MTIRHNQFLSDCRNAGFSMIDVLVAIVVLATGLLALAVLQAAMTRNAADSRARSQIATFAEGLIDRARSSGNYDCIGSGTPTCSTPVTSGKITITPKSSGTTAETAAYAAQAAAGVSNLSVSQTVSTYYGAGGTFTTTPPANLDSSTPQYKQLNITSSWTDASGTPRTLALDTIISPITIKNDPSVVDKVLYSPTTAASTPVVRELNPAAPGVIPIAVGNGTDTAATNPKPEILGSKSNQQVVGTSYNVLTYQSPDANNEVQVQKRVETQVVHCSCKYGAGSTTSTNVFAQAYRPTYWDGTKYVAPQAVTASAGTAGTNAGNPGEDTTALQSDYCTECCRDHHDAASDKVKFDPFNTDTTTQYKTYRYGAAGSFIEVPISDTTNAYMSSCRLIRVDGLFRTATDLNSYHFGLLGTAAATSGGPQATSPIPDTPYVADYQKFITDYLNVAFVNPATGPLSTSAANALYTKEGLDQPTEIDITYNTTTPDKRFLHARGLYIDHLEKEALQAISDALANTCPTGNQADCVLPLLPFTTINVTELANWCVTPSGTPCVPTNAILQVSDQAIIGGNATDPQRGVVLAEATAKSGDTSNALAAMTISNSGVAVGQPVDPNDQTSLNDSQFFKVTSGAAAATVPFDVVLGPTTVLTQLVDTSTTDDPSVSWQIGSAQSACPAIYTGKGSSTALSKYTCTPNVAPAQTVVLIKNFNTTTPNARQTNPCNSKQNITLYTCNNYQVDPNGTTLNGVNVSKLTTVAQTGVDGALSEGATITFPTLDTTVAETIGIAFKLQGTTNAPYTCGGVNNATLTWTYPSTFCQP